MLGGEDPTRCDGGAAGDAATGPHDTDPGKLALEREFLEFSRSQVVSPNDRMGGTGGTHHDA